jgi:hypothetical protein
MTSGLSFPPTETPEEMMQRAIQPDGSLDDIRGYLCWLPNHEPRGITLDGVFTPEELIAIANYVLARRLL